MNRRGLLSFLAAAPVAAPIAAQAALQDPTARFGNGRAVGSARLAFDMRDFSGLRFSDVRLDIRTADQFRIDQMLSGMGMPEAEPRAGRAWAPPQVREIA